jgi:hypothetical protein
LLQRRVFILAVVLVVVSLRAHHLTLEILGLLGVISHWDSLVGHGRLHGVLVVLELRLVCIVVDGIDALLPVPLLNVL